MKKFKFALGAWTFLAGCFLFSCSSGLGESIDLEAPVLEITSPSHGQFVPKTFTLTGIATDNKKVNSVEIEYKYKKNGETISDKRTAILTGEKWECEFSFDGDYEVEFEAYAYDALKNGSDTSHQRIMLLIDSQDPETDKMSIVRGDYVARLYPLEEFTKNGGITEQKDDPKNKDNFQNEKITLVTTLNDNYGIGHISLDLYEVDKDTKVETLVVKDIEPDSTENKYSPRFTIKEEMLPQNIRTGLHYLRPHLTVADIAGNQTPEIHQNKNVFAWESEYNTPHVSFTSLQSEPERHILLEKGAPVIVTVFDDDKLKSCHYSGSLVESKNSVQLSDSSEVVKGSRDLSFEIATKKSKDPNAEDLDVGTYYFAIKVEDETGRTDGTYYEVIKVVITNAEAPVIIVNSPKENSAPELAEGKFTIEGKVIDNEANLNKIAIAWLPNGNDDISKAEKFFKSYAFDADKEYEGIKIYNLPEKGKIESTTDKDFPGKYVYEFSKKFDFFNDFIINGKAHNENKVFMIAAKDPTENLVTSTFRLSKISSAPKFKVGYTNYNEDGSQYSNQEPAENFMFTPLANRKTTFTIEPFSESNLKITEFSVAPTDINNNNGKKESYSNKTGDAITIDFNTNEANLGKVYRYTLSATDQIGGASKEILTIQFDQFGSLQSITCEAADKKIFKAGETIRLQANFDYKVVVNENEGIEKPRIIFSGDDNSPLYAEYKGGSHSNTLYFEYPVTASIERRNLKIDGIENKEAIEGNIPINYNKTDFANKKYSIDTIAPYLTGMTPGNGGVVEKGSKTSVTITFTFNEPVTMESGTITIKRTDGWYIPPVIEESVFLKIFNEKSNNTYKGYLCGTTDLTSNEKYIGNTLIPKGPYMQYTNGIIADGNVMVPDLTTKYVLAYDLNIDDTTSQNAIHVREALENAGYHKAEFDFSRMISVKKNNEATNEVQLVIEEEDFIGGLVNGVEYEIIFNNLRMHDDAYHYSTLKDKLNLDGDYKFWVGPVATPVIRVNRTATNDNKLDGSTHDPFRTDGVYNEKEGKFCIGQTTFKIDCVTPGATVSYNTRTKSETAPSFDDKDDDAHNTITIPNIGETEFYGDWGSAITNVINGTIEANNKIGTNDPNVSEKIYIRAKATKNDLNDSDYGKEGAFKTVLHYYFTKMGNTNWSFKNKNENETTKNAALITPSTPIKTPLRIHGAQIAEGSSYTAGWPLTQNGNNRSDYQIAFVDTKNHFYWVSWQILSDFNMQTYSTDFQNPANDKATYGMYYYYKNPGYWGEKNIGINNDPS